MSAYPTAPRSGAPAFSASSNGNGPPVGNAAGPAPNMSSMMGPNGNSDLMAGMDMDISLPMDLDLDLAQTPPRQPFQSMSQQPQQSIHPMQQMQLQQQPVLSQQQPLNGALTPHDNSTPSSAAVRPDNFSGAGAGPLPHTFGAPSQSAGSTLTEFTKRRNWSQRIIEEIKDFLHILTADGRIIYASPSCRGLTGYSPQALVGKFIGEYVHPDDGGIFMREFNESIATGNTLRFFYRFKKEDGTYVIFECDGHPHMVDDCPPSGFDPGPNGQMSNWCRGFFMMARPYPTKSAALLDSFLGHKIENEKLMKRIADLKREEKEDNAEADRFTQGQTTNTVDSRSLSNEVEASPAKPNYEGMPPPAKPPISNIALTQQNLDSAQSAQKPDSIADKMSRYEANSGHLESIEMLTGLRYRDGERSHGISTGDTSPALVRGDAGIAILLDRDRDGNRKEKKKIKVEDEYVCSDCGTLDSPEWRKGPKGPKTLCNACGLRWAKKEKKHGSNHSPVGGLLYQQSNGSNMTPPSALSSVVSAVSGTPTMMRNGSQSTE